PEIAERPFFLTVGTWETHRPWPAEDYEAADPSAVDVPTYLPDNADTREDIAAFHGSIQQLDEAIGRILRSLDNSAHADNTMVIFTTDHGAAFPRAKSTLYDSGVGVALIVRPPRSWNQPPGRRSALTSHLDVAPTLVEVAGGEPPENLEGESFLDTLRDPTRSRPTRELFLEKSHHDRYDPIRAIRTDRAKYIRNYEPGPQVPLALDLEESPTRRGMDELLPPKPAEELYLLRDDPSELHNLAPVPAFEQLRAELSSRLDHHLHRTGDPILDGASDAPPAPSRHAHEPWSGADHSLPCTSWAGSRRLRGRCIVRSPGSARTSRDSKNTLARCCSTGMCTLPASPRRVKLSCRTLAGWWTSGALVSLQWRLS